MLIILSLKIGMYFAFIHNSTVHKVDGIFIDTADRGEYIVPMDNYAEYGNYSLTSDGEPYAGRLPGFVFPYMLFRFFLNSSWSGRLLGLFIVGFSLLASVALLRLIHQLTGSLLFAWVSVFAAEIISYFWHWDWVLHPFSMGASCLILHLYFMRRYFISSSRYALLWAGFFIAWLFMLRGITILFVPVACMMLFVHLSRQGIGFSGKASAILILLAPLAIMESFWIGRNYYSLHKFIPLQTAFVPGTDSELPEYGFKSHTKYSLLELRKLINKWGGENFWFFTDGDMNWFTDPVTRRAAESQFPAAALDVVTVQGFERFRGDVQYSFREDLTKSQHDSIEQRIVTRSRELALEFDSKHRAYTIFVAPLNRWKNMLVRNPTQDWWGPGFASSNPGQKAIKLISVFSYGGVLFLSVLVSLFLAKAIYANIFQLLLASYTATMFFTFGFVLNVTHYTYFMYGYLPAVILVAWGIQSLLPRFLPKRQPKIFDASYS